MSSTPPPTSSAGGPSGHQQALEAFQQKILVKDRQIQRLKTELVTSQTKVGKLAVDNLALGHRNLILRAQADDAEKDLKDMKSELYRIIEEAESAQKKVSESREGERQARKDTSIALGEVERLNGVASGLMKELEESRADSARKEAERLNDEDSGVGSEVERLNGIIVDLKDSLSTYETILGAADTESVALAKVVELKKTEATLRRLLDTADRDLVAAQGEIEALKTSMAKREQEGRRYR